MGSPDTLVRVAIANDDLSARLLAGLLEARRVPASVFGEFAATILGPSSAPAAIYVRHIDHALATEILTQLAYGVDPAINHCHHCDYPLDDIDPDEPGDAVGDDARRCPECGGAVDLRAFDKQGHCVACRYDLMGLEADVCPECGLDLRLMGKARSRFSLVPAPGRTPFFVRIVATLGWIALGAFIVILVTLAVVVLRHVLP